VGHCSLDCISTHEDFLESICCFADVPRGILLRYDAQIEKNGQKSEVREERSARA